VTSGADNLFSRLGIQEGDTVTIVVDEVTDPRVGEILFSKAVELGADADLSRVRGRHTNGENLPPQVVAALRASDIAILATTTWSASHSAGVIAAIEGGVRVLSMPGVTVDMFNNGAMTADYDEVERLTVIWGEQFARGRRIRITTAKGTDLTAELGGLARTPFLDTGSMGPAGGLANMPGGEVAFAPIEGTTEGVVIADVMLSTTPGNLESEVRIDLARGRVIDVSGGPAAQEFVAELDRHGESSRVVAEIAVGTNASARLVGVVLEDEKLLGTAHVGFGHSVGIGGLNASTIHADAIMADATVSIDGIEIIRNGQVTPEGQLREALAAFNGRGGAYRPTGLPSRSVDGRLEAPWIDSSGLERWARVGDDESAALVDGWTDRPLEAQNGTLEARKLQLLARYGLVERVVPEAPAPKEPAR
jgi:leucyl aminopeptidase (aminopeptidase T)